MSVVDVLVAFSLLLTAVFISMNAFPTSARAARMARLNLLATHLAQAQLEQVTKQPFSTIANVPSSTVAVTERMNGNTETIQFTVALTASLVAGNTSLKDVVATVSWTEGSQTRTVKTETLVANMQ